MNKPVEEILKERGSIYGDARENLACTEVLRDTFQHYHDKNPLYKNMVDIEALKTRRAHKNAIDMVLHKISRLACGPVLCEDHYKDAMGYLELARKIIMGESCV